MTPITYVTRYPLHPSHLDTDAPHVHHRGSDKCLRAPDGEHCPTPAELRAEVERLTSVVDVLRAVRAVRDVKAWEAESATAERDALQQQVARVETFRRETLAALPEQYTTVAHATAIVLRDLGAALGGRRTPTHEPNIATPSTDGDLP